MKRLEQLANVKEFEKLAALPGESRQAVANLQRLPSCEWPVFIQTFIQILKEKDKLGELYRIVPVEEVLREQKHMYDERCLQHWSNISLMKDWRPFMSIF